MDMTIVGMFNDSSFKNICLNYRVMINSLTVVYHFEHFHALNGINFTICTFTCDYRINRSVINNSHEK